MTTKIRPTPASTYFAATVTSEVGSRLAPHPTILHHEVDALQPVDIAERVHRGGHQVGGHSDSQRAALPLDAQERRGPARHGAQNLQGRDPSLLEAVDV